MSNLSQRLADFALAPLDDRASAARNMMRLSLYDWIICGLAGVDEPVSRIVRNMPAAPGSCVVFGTPDRMAPAAAALINGATSHALDYDDTHFAHIGHPSVVIFPAVFAIGGASVDMLDAALVGAEVSVRVGQWLGRSHYQTGFHQTATAGAFGATAAAGRLLELSAEQLDAAFGVAATQAAGLKSQFGTMGKPYHAGLAARTGVEAALLARAGFDTRGAGLDGPQGFGSTHAGENNSDVFAGLGQNWRMEHVSHKFHACCHGLHAMLEALRQVEVAGKTPDHLTIRTHPRWMSVCNIADPATGLECKFSYRHTAAMALLGQSTAALDRYTDAMASDPDLARMRARMSIVEDETLPETASHVSVAWAGCPPIEAMYDLNAPISAAEIARKLRAKGQALLPPDTEARVWETSNANKAPDMDALSDLVSKRV